MERSTDSDERVILTDRYAPLKRLLIGGFGLAGLSLATWELAPAVLAADIASPFFLIIWGGAGLVAGSFLASSVIGDDTRLELRKTGAHLIRKNLLRRREFRLGATAVREVTIRRHDWEDRAPEFSVEVLLDGAGRVSSGLLATREAAERLIAEIRALSLASRDP